MSHEVDIRVKIFPQRCFKCSREIPNGEEAYAHRVNPVAICVPCAGPRIEQNREWAKAVVRE